MAIIINDPVLLEQLARASDSIEIRDSNGNYIGSFAPPPGKPPAGFALPYSDEEIAQRRTIREGKPLAEILKNLQEKQ